MCGATTLTRPPLNGNHATVRFEAPKIEKEMEIDGDEGQELTAG
jgi:hypothetical protein